MNKLITGLLALSPFLTFAEGLSLDPAHSEVTFSVRHMGLSRVKGEFESFEAHAEVEDDQLVSVHAKIDVSSIDTGNSDRDGHLLSGDFFEAEEHPSIEFKSTEIKDGKLHGHLTIKGTTKEVALDMEFLGPEVDPWGNTRYGLTLEGELDRRDYGLTWNRMTEAGGIVVGHTVTLSISVQFME